LGGRGGKIFFYLYKDPSYLLMDLTGWRKSQHGSQGLADFPQLNSQKQQVRFSAMLHV
jgi:hypothetical protein